MEDAAVADEQPAYPVLVLSPSVFPPLLLAAIAEELASHGYVVAGVNHTYETAVTVFADGRVVPVNPAAQAGVLGPQTGPGECPRDAPNRHQQPAIATSSSNL